MITLLRADLNFQRVVKLFDETESIIAVCKS
jgi:hypothetical protein